MPLRSCQRYVEANDALWQKALEHDFLHQCAEAKIADQQFNTWLQQDYHFAVGFVRFLAFTLASAPAHDFELLAGGLTALQDELRWFKAKAQQRGLDLSISVHSKCAAYLDLMQSLKDAPYEELAMAAWAIEYAYHEGWRRAGPMKPPYDEFNQRWGSEDFGKYVKQLEQQANKALQDADKDVVEKACKTCNKIAEAEVEFWQMALDATI